MLREPVGFILVVDARQHTQPSPAPQIVLGRRSPFSGPYIFHTPRNFSADFPFGQAEGFLLR